MQTRQQTYTLPRQYQRLNRPIHLNRVKSFQRCIWDALKYPRRNVS